MHLLCSAGLRDMPAPFVIQAGPEKASWGVAPFIPPPRPLARLPAAAVAGGQGPHTRAITRVILILFVAAL